MISPPFWQDPTNPEHMRALEFLRDQAGSESNFEFDTINSAIECVQKFIAESKPQEACFYNSQLKCVIRNLPITKIQF